MPIYTRLQMLIVLITRLQMLFQKPNSRCDTIAGMCDFPIAKKTNELADWSLGFENILPYNRIAHILSLW